MIDQTHHDEGTLFKVRDSLLRAGFSHSQAMTIVNAVLNAGVVFREKRTDR